MAGRLCAVWQVERRRVGTRSRQENWVGFGQQERTKENIHVKECERKIQWQESPRKCFSHFGRYQNHLGKLFKIQRPSPVLLQPAWVSGFFIGPDSPSKVWEPLAWDILKGQWDKMMQTRDALWSEVATTCKLPGSPWTTPGDELGVGLVWGNPE